MKQHYPAWQIALAIGLQGLAAALALGIVVELVGQTIRRLCH